MDNLKKYEVLDKTRDKLGKFLLKIRKSRNLTLREIGNLADISFTYLAHIERNDKGKSGILSPEALTRVFDVYKLTEEEKKEFLKIYLNYLLPKQMQKNLTNEVLEILSKDNK